MRVMRPCGSKSGSTSVSISLAVPSFPHLRASRGAATRPGPMLRPMPLLGGSRSGPTDRLTPKWQACCFPSPTMRMRRWQPSQSEISMAIFRPWRTCWPRSCQRWAGTTFGSFWEIRSIADPTLVAALIALCGSNGRLGSRRTSTSSRQIYRSSGFPTWRL